MKQHEMVIEINGPVQDVFAFTINPVNTPTWIEDVLKEESSAWPIHQGTFYRRTTAAAGVERGIEQTEYQVTGFEANRLFELRQKDGPCHVRYRCDALADDKTRLTYLEWADDGELLHPLPVAALQTLKAVLEGRHVEKRKRAVMIELTRYKVKKGKTERVNEWMDMLRDAANTPENVAVLESEKMFVETIFREFDGEDEYLYWFSIQGAGPSALNQSGSEVDRKHIEFANECIDRDTSWQGSVDMKLEVSMILDRVKRALE